MRKIVSIFLFLLISKSIFCQQSVFKYHTKSYYESYKENGNWTEWKDAITDEIKSVLIVTDINNDKINFYDYRGTKDFSIVKAILPIINTDTLVKSSYICVDNSNKTCQITLELQFSGDKQAILYVEYASFKMKFVLRNE